MLPLDGIQETERPLFDVSAVSVSIAPVCVPLERVGTVAVL